MLQHLYLAYLNSNSNSLLIWNPTKDCHQQQHNQQTYTKHETIKNKKFPSDVKKKKKKKCGEWFILYWISNDLSEGGIM